MYHLRISHENIVRSTTPLRFVWIGAEKIKIVKIFEQTNGLKKKNNKITCFTKLYNFRARSMWIFQHIFLTVYCSKINNKYVLFLMILKVLKNLLAALLTFYIKFHVISKEIMYRDKIWSG